MIDNDRLQDFSFDGVTSLFNSTKTQRKEYDKVVTASLLILKFYLKEDMRLASDVGCHGFSEDVRFLKDVFNTDFSKDSSETALKFMMLSLLINRS